MYSMRLTVGGDVAMFLPVPVAHGTGEDGLRFVDLSKYPTFFEDLERGFERTDMLSLDGGFDGPPRLRSKLVVHRVGAFEASYVPSRDDLDRLDARFRLPASLWAALRDYDDWGFAVFRLRPGTDTKIHPMGFRFVSRDPARLFFPTVHVHDGQFHPTAAFDHALYYQPEPGRAAHPDWTTMDPAAAFMRIADTAGLVAADLPVSRRQLVGELPNADTWISTLRT